MYWQSYYAKPWPWPHIRLIDGSTKRGTHLMRRKNSKGEWEYRELTEAEKTDLYFARQW
jgi:hypothetical protein